MAHSIEGRFPFLDHRVVEFAARVPPHLKMKVLNEKYLLKQAAGDLVPSAVRKRTKQPYRAPEASSFFDESSHQVRHEYAEKLLSTKMIREIGIFNPAAVTKLVEKARNGRTVGIKDNMAVVGILSTQLLMEQFTENFGRPSGHAFD
jgi:asparagine synthase (glutamine-hydrolysing)